jgi:hypothetical protein
VQPFTFSGSKTEPALSCHMALISSRTMPRLCAGGGVGPQDGGGANESRECALDDKLHDTHHEVRMFSPADIRAGRYTWENEGG